MFENYSMTARVGKGVGEILEKLYRYNGRLWERRRSVIFKKGKALGTACKGRRRGIGGESGSGRLKKKVEGFLSFSYI